MAERKRQGLGGGRRQSEINDQFAPEGTRLNDLSVLDAFGRQVAAPVGPNGQRLSDSLNVALQDDTYYGSGRTQQKFGRKTTRMPLTGAFYGRVASAIRSPVGLPYGDNLYVSVDDQSGDLPAGIGTDVHSAALASGATDAGVAYVGKVKVGSQNYANNIKTSAWDEKTEAAAVALGMTMAGREQADNLRKAGYKVEYDGSGNLVGYQRGSKTAVRALGVKSGNKRLNGSFGFAMRANQQANYWQGGETAQGRRDLAERLITNRGADGLVETPGAFPLNKARIEKPRSGRGYRTGIVFTPRDASGAPIPIGGDLYSKDYQCRVENSGPGISDYTDNQGNQSAGFRLFPRRNKKAGTVSCGYSPDIFANTLSASYTQGGRRVMAGNSLAAELNRRGQGAVARRLDEGVAELNRNRGAFYGRSLKRKPQGIGGISDSDDKMQAWLDRQAL